ncbi:MAG: tryptophanase [Deltaproteobacteria bacterium]|nr:tryptophanase [Deltaproteobacteria bacterium]
MKNDFGGISFSIPYEIAAVRPLRQTTLREREEALRKAHYNTELILQEMVYVDLKTDSGVSSFSTGQVAAVVGAQPLETTPEMASEGNRAFLSLADRFRELFGFPFVVPCSHGRAAERIWAKINVRQGSVVPGNMLFPSTRFHIESNGAKVIDVISEEAHDLFSDHPFKGNVDIGKLAAVLKESGGEKVSCIYVELCVNSCGGHPVSLANLKEVQSLARARGIPLFLDGSRILENSYLIKQREPGYQDRSVGEIVRETCSLADGCTMSALKDFLVSAGGFIGIRDEKSYQRAYVENFFDGTQLPASAMDNINTALSEIFHSPLYVASRVEQVNYLWRRLQGGIPVLAPAAGHAVFIDAKSFLAKMAPEHHPAEALAAFVYSISGVRITKGPPLAQSQNARGIELLRLAVPARRYLQGHMDDVAEALLYAYSRRDEIQGLKRIEKPGRPKYDPPLFRPVRS